MHPTSWFEYLGTAFLIQDNKIYSYGESCTEKAELTYVINSHPEFVKVYDTQRFIANASMVGSAQIS